MQQPSFDPGLTQQYTGRLRRAINQDGSFNVKRRGTDWRDVHPYLHMVTMPWWRFFLVILGAYAVMNLIFATIYFALGPDALQGGNESAATWDMFLRGVFFSSQTLTTVGFGAIAPKSHVANLVAAIEALVGLLGFAVATGVLLGRVSRPSARIGFSEQALMAPYQDGYALQFRLVNRRTNSLMEVEATVMLMKAATAGRVLKRDFALLKLERDKVMFFPLTWTVVHPVDVDSPFYGKSAAELADMEVEILVMVKAWDETFSQTVYQRFSYRHDDIVWDAKFAPAFVVGSDGGLVLEVNGVGAHIAVHKG